MRPDLIPVLFGDPPGIPRNGLIAHHDLYAPNILLQSNSFGTTWGAGRSAVVQSAAAYTPDGTLSWKLVEDSTAANTHYVLQNIAVSVCSTFAVKCKAAERTWVQLQMAAGIFASFNLSTGVVGTKHANYSASSCTALGDGWYLCSATLGGASAGTYVGIYIGEADNDYTFDGTGSAPYTEADPGIYIADAQLYPATTLPPYASTTTLQSFTDLSGKGNTLTRGSNTTAADTNDPTVAGPGLIFDGTGAADDYCPAALTGLASLAGPWSLILAAKNTYAADTGLAGLGSAANIYAGINSSSANTMKAVSADAGGATASTGTITATDGTAYVFALVNNGTTLSLYRTDDMSSCSVALETMSGTPVLTIGAYNTTTSAIQTATAYEDWVYNRVLSAAEMKRIRRVLRNKWGARAVTLT